MSMSARNFQSTVVEPPPRTGDGSTQEGDIYAQDCSTIQLTSLAHEVALSKAFEPPLLAM